MAIHNDDDSEWDIKHAKKIIDSDFLKPLIIVLQMKEMLKVDDGKKKT